MAIRSPFPGMDPYLEQYWTDVHPALITYARDQLQGNLPSQYTARMEERLLLESANPQYSRTIIPDVSIRREEWAASESTAASEGGVAVADPIVLKNVQSEPMKQNRVEIIYGGDAGRIVTVIEFLSPSNKRPGLSRDLYLQKQEEIWGTNISSVEIDLIRQGESVFPDHDIARLPEQPQTHYLACIRKAWSRHSGEYYQFLLRQRLPGLRIPLLEKDPEVILDLQALIDQCYRNGRYDRTDYKRPLDPPLNSYDAHWAKEMVRRQIQ